ncbi:MAG: serine hydrolase [Spirochaetales bacterium]|nr:serine hydrolase [Spirochaetales bacterium]
MKRDYWPTDEWRIAEPSSLGMDPGKLVELNRTVKDQYATVNGLMVVRKGYIVFENYYNGFKQDKPQHVASVTKSFLSALIGLALSKGYIQRVDQKVLSFFPEYEPAPGDIQKRLITLRHLLTMTAPMAWKKSDTTGHEPLDRLRRQRNWVQFILELLGQNGRPGAFQYSTAGAHLLSAVLTRSAGMCARQFANEHLFKPLGIREIPDYPEQGFLPDDVFGDTLKGWVHDPQGNTAGGWGLTISVRDMARFGLLYVSRGIWEGGQIIPAEWIDESWAENPHDYGYLWWLKKEGDIFVYAALGAGGNAIYCIPEKDLVVVIASEIILKARDRWPLMTNCILPAVTE